MNRGWVSAGDIAYLLYPIVPFRWLVALGRLHGRMQATLNWNRRSIVHDNLRRAFGDERGPSDIRRMTREFFEFERIRALLITLAPRMSLERMRRAFPLEGLEHLDRALEQRRGVILLGSHINSVAMFLAVIMLRRLGYPVGVALPEQGDAWGRTRLRQALDRLGEGRETVGEAIGGFYCQFNIRPIVRRLACNEIVAQTGDGWHSAKFVEVEFLGRKLPFTTGSASIAQLTGAIIVPIFPVGRPADGMRFVLEEGFSIGKQDPVDLEQKVAGYVRSLECHLRENIPCWQHWLVPATLDSMADWTRRSLNERYRVSHSGTDH